MTTLRGILPKHGLDIFEWADDEDSNISEESLETEALDPNSVSGVIAARFRAETEALDPAIRIVRVVLEAGVEGILRRVFDQAIKGLQASCVIDFQTVVKPDPLLARSVDRRVFVFCEPDEKPPLYQASFTISWTNEDLSDLAERKFGRAPAPIDRLIHAGSAELVLRTSQTVEIFDSLIAQYVGFLNAADEIATGNRETLQQRGSSTADRAAFTGQHVELHRPAGPRASELHGYGMAKEWAVDLAMDIQAYKNGEVEWADVDRGCVVHGPPGTGKTLFATAVAAECKVPVIYTSYAAWSSVGEGHMGYVTKSIRATFKVAAENAPCIIFIDELDTIVGRANGNGSYRDDWWTTITTTILEQLDGALRTDGIVVIGATNFVKAIDEAMLRSGRLDRTFEIGFPDEKALCGILSEHFSDLGTAVSDLDAVATALAGTTSGADIARLGRECRRIARRDRRPITADLIIAHALPPETRSAEFVRRIAIHEAGHAVVGRLVGDRVNAASIVHHARAAGHVHREPAEIDQTASSLDRLVIPMLGGRAAELVILGDCSAGAASDLATATNVIAAGETGGLGRWLSSGDAERESVEVRLRRLHGDAMMLALRHKGIIEALGALLIERRVLSERSLTAFFSDHGI